MVVLGRSQFFNPSCRVAVPGLATGALPEVLFGFESASSTPVAQQGLDGMVQRALNLWMKLLVFELFAGNPFGGGHQLGLVFQVAHIPVACGGYRSGLRGFQRHDGIEHV